MADPAIREWQVPPPTATESHRLGYISESTEEGEAWLKSQRGYADFSKALNVIAGRDPATKSADYRSKVYPNRLKRNARQVIGALAKLRPMWGYHSDNKAFKSPAEMMNKTTRALYLENFFDLSIYSALQYAAATCRGWVRPMYRRPFTGSGQGQITLKTYGSPCVLPVQLPSDGNFQEAYIVNILDEMPVYMTHAMWPLHQHKLRPSSSRYWYSNDNVRKSAEGNWLSRAFGKIKRKTGDNALSDLLVPVRYSYINDLSINVSGQTVKIGESGATWAYEVPSYGSDFMGRKADENDARLYPRRRLMISSDNCIMYDGPAFDWHGMVPAFSFTVDAWPWEPLGFSLVHDGYEINESIKQIYRGNLDKINAQLDPSLMYDTDAVSMKEARAFDPMQPRARLGFSGQSVGEQGPWQLAMPEQLLKVEPESMSMIEKLEQTLDDQMGIKDIMALAALRAGSMDDMEKTVEANGPIVESMSRLMEPPMRDLGVAVKYLVLQYMTTARLMQYVGEDGVSREIFDFQPDTIVPSHLPGEDPDKGESKYNRIQRARTFADNLRFFILPNSLHELTQMAMKLGFVQLKKAGVKIDSQTVAEAWSVPNWGTLPGNTVLERFKAEQEMDLEFAARMKEMAEGLGMLPGQPPGAAGPGKQPEGRPSSGQQPPQIVQKDGGARSTISESGK